MAKACLLVPSVSSALMTLVNMANEQCMNLICNKSNTYKNGN